jgi:hypothetical protein
MRELEVSKQSRFGPDERVNVSMRTSRLRLLPKKGARKRVNACAQGYY